MSTSDGQPLTRRQLRELRQTGQNPIITDEQLAAAERESEERSAEEPVERDETAHPEAADAETREPAPEDELAPEEESVPESDAPEHESVPENEHVSEEDTSEPEIAEPEVVELEVVEERPLTRRELRERLRTGAMSTVTAETAEPQQADPDTRTEALVEVDAVIDDAHAVEATITDETTTQRPHGGVDAAGETGAGESDETAPTVRPGFGAHLGQDGEAADDEGGERPDAPSFDDLITHSEETGGSSSAPSMLILKENPDAGAFNAPITSTGELLITSSHKLPEGFGSRGAAQGTTDGREIDAVLIDGEIPLASSPTPIAASEAISTSKSPGEVIRPPAPEKNHRLILTLGITAGALGIAVVGAVVIAYATGVLG